MITTPYAILGSAALLSITMAIKWHDDAPRYQLAGLQPGIVARLDVRTGSIDLCATRPYIEALLDQKDFKAIGLESGMAEPEADKLAGEMMREAISEKCFELNHGKRAQ